MLTLTLQAEKAGDNKSLLEFALSFMNDTASTVKAKEPKVVHEVKKRVVKKGRIQECPVCHKKFKGALGMGVHMYKHPECKAGKIAIPKPYTCAYCDETFNTRAGRGIHTGRLHKGMVSKHSPFSTNYLETTKENEVNVIA